MLFWMSKEYNLCSTFRCYESKYHINNRAVNRLQTVTETNEWQLYGIHEYLLRKATNEDSSKTLTFGGRQKLSIDIIRTGFFVRQINIFKAVVKISLKKIITTFLCSVPFCCALSSMYSIWGCTGSTSSLNCCNGRKNIKMMAFTYGSGGMINCANF